MLNPRSLHEIEAEYVDADIYLFSDREPAKGLGRDIVHTFGRERVRGFVSLSECVSEAMDFKPCLIVLDVQAISPAINIQLQRLRNDRNCSHIPVLIRAEVMTGAQLAKLIHQGASAVIMASLHNAQAVARVRQLMNGEADAPQLPEKGVFKAIRDAQVDMCHSILPDAERLARIKKHYRLDIDCLFMAQAGAGGDLWDVMPIDATRLAVFTADFCGHGLHVAPNTLRLSSLMYSEGFDRSDPSAVLSWVNDRLRALLPAGQFAAMAYAVFDVAAGEVAFSCSAHMPPLIRASDALPWAVHDCNGFPLGFLADAQFETVRRPFGAGAGLLLYSDALVETPLPPHHRFDSASLVDFCNGLPESTTMLQLNQALKGALNLDHISLDDDLTILGIRRL